MGIPEGSVPCSGDFSALAGDIISVDVWEASEGSCSYH